MASNKSVEYKLNIDTNQATSNIDKLDKALNKASTDADKLQSNLQEAGSANIQVNTQGIEDVATSLDKASEKAENFRVQTDNVQKVSAGVQGAFSMMVGSMALFGDESEEITKIMTKLTAVMAMTNGLKAMGEGFKGLTDSIKMAKEQGKLFNTVMKASVIGLIVSAVALLIANFDKLRERFTWINDAANKASEIFDGLSGVFSNIIPVITNLGKTIGLALVSPIRTIIDGYEGIGKIIKAVFEGDFDSIPDIVKGTLDDMKDNFTDVGDAAKDLGTTVADSYNKGVADGIKEKNKLSEEQIEALREARKKVAEDQASITEELRRANLTERQRELDDIDLWYKEAQQKAHGNNDILAAIEEERNKRIKALNDRYHQEELDSQAKFAASMLAMAKELARQQEENAAQDRENRSAKNEYDYSTGAIDDSEYLNNQLKIEQEKLALLDEGTAAYYQQLAAVNALNEAIEYEGSSAMERWQTKSAKAMKNFKKEWKNLDLGSQIGYISDQMSSFGSALSDMFSAIMDGMDENSEEYKALAITQTVINTLVGIQAAISGCFTEKSGPWDIALAAIQAAAILTSGIVTINKIASANESSGSSLSGTSTDVVSGVSGSESAVAGVGVSDSSLSEATGTNSQNMRSDTGAQDHKVYVTETDITQKQNKRNRLKTQVAF